LQSQDYSQTKTTLLHREIMQIRKHKTKNQGEEKNNEPIKEILSFQNTPYSLKHSKTTKIALFNYLNQLQSNFTTHLQESKKQILPYSAH
jgi:hypothetical protein